MRAALWQLSGFCSCRSVNRFSAACSLPRSPTQRSCCIAPRMNAVGTIYFCARTDVARVSKLRMIGA
jgi:hypothetical protein